MKFLYPSYLWALLLVAIPVLIHYLNLRKHKTVYFSNVAFLKLVQRESNRLSKLKQFIMMVLRVLAIAALVLAFARPYKPLSDMEQLGTQNVVGIYIDNSFSMNSESPDGKAIENAKSKAHAIVQASMPGTRFALLTNEMSQVQNRFFTAPEIMNLISIVEPGYQQIRLSAVIERFRSMTANFLEQTDKKFYVISDFQKVTTDPENIEHDSSATYTFIPIPINSVANLSLDSCWFQTPAHYLEQREEIVVRIRNYSKESYLQLPINLYLNDTLKALASVDLEPGETKEVVLTYTNQKVGFQLGRIEISDYPIVYDNTLYFSYVVYDQINALSVMPLRSSSVRQRSLEALFRGNNFVKMDVEYEERLQISRLSDYSTVFLNETRFVSSGLTEVLKTYVQNGGTLVFIPDNRGDIGSYNQLLEALNCNTIEQADTVSISVSSIFYEHPVYRDVFKEKELKVEWPKIQNRFRFNQVDQLVETPLIRFADNSKALSVSSFGKGRVMVFAFQVSEASNKFIEHLLFVPTMFNIVLTSAIYQQPYHEIVTDLPLTISLPSDIQVLGPKLEKLKGNEVLYPDIRKVEGNRVNLFLDAVVSAGHYQLTLNNEPATVLSLNYNLSESDLQFYTPDEMKSSLIRAGIKKLNVVTGRGDTFAEAIEELYSGRHFWRLFLIIALAFLLAEAAVIRFWKG